MENNIETATFAGGCFWCSEYTFKNQKGVVSVISGYVSDNKKEKQPTYELVSTGKTSFREAVQITFNPNKISYEQLLDIYWRHINPTQNDGQFADRGFHYTTAIYYHTNTQKEIATKSKQELEKSKKFEKPIITQIIEYGIFYEAEEYHQDYSDKNTDHYEMYSIGSGRKGFIEKNWRK